MIAAIALLTLGMSSCHKDDDNGTDNGNTPTNPTNPTTVEWIDLGLPSGLLWAKCNLGATTPEGYGNYYAWGETQPKYEYTWETYTYGDYDGAYHLYKYNTSDSYGTVDNKTTLEAMDDAATAALGTGARIPTYDDWVELRSNTTGEWTQQNGVNGWKFTATNGNTLFLPAAGYRDGSSLCNDGTDGGYWSSSLLSDYPDGARSFFLRWDGSYMSDSRRRYGVSVRAVRSRN